MEPSRREPVRVLDGGWEVAALAPGGDLSGAEWLPARVPGTAAAALADAGRWRPGDTYDFDALDWVFRIRFDEPPAAADEEVVLRLDGVATVADVRLNGEQIIRSVSMFERHQVDVGNRLSGAGNELVVHCHALRPLLELTRRPRARWRTRIADGNLRWFRTMVVGRAPGFAPGPAAVGPWRPIRIERRRGLVADALQLRPRVEGPDGVLDLRVPLRSIDGEPLPASVAVEVRGPTGTLSGSLPVEADVAAGQLRLPGVALWWPHTHGEPALYDVSVHSGPTRLADGRTGFRTLEWASDLERDGLDLRVNGVPVFARGAVWTAADPVSLAPGAEEIRALLERVRAGGMNIVRLAGTGAYEEPTFFDLCDELGLLVWQDFMFANLDYPFADPDFAALATDEAQAVLADLAGRPSHAVLCGNSEVEQQVAMLGLAPSLGRSAFFEEKLPALARAAGADVPYVPSAPCGGEPPFRPDRGIANYYGVGGYRRPLTDARLAEVRFAAECLAFANVPDEPAVAALGPDLIAHDARWKAGVPRDAGSDWDFDDVRDHYLQLLYGWDAAELRRLDPARYLDVSRAVSGDVMAETMGEWRRAGSPCRGAIVLWLRDLAPGAGWGVLDSSGAPKAAWHQLRRALAPLAVWTTDEGLAGIDVHVANDRPEPFAGQLRVALYADGERRVDEARTDIAVERHGSLTLGVEEILGRFADVAWSYRFGPPAHDTVVATLERSGVIVGQAFRFPTGRPRDRRPLAAVGLEARLGEIGEGAATLSIRSRCVAHVVRIDAPGWELSDDAFSLEPQTERTIALVSTRPSRPPAVHVTALNVEGCLSVEPEPIG